MADHSHATPSATPHVHGTMDVTDHQRTFEGFMRFWVYLAATAIGGYAWEKAGYAWYDTVCDRNLAQDADFEAFAKLTIAHGEKRSGGDVGAAIKQAWEQVGVL